MRLLRAQLHTGESGEWGGGGRARTATSSIPWLATTPECDQSVAAPPFLGSPGPQLDLPDPQPVHFFEQLVDIDILQLIVTETNRFRDLGRGRGVVGNNTKATICTRISLSLRICCKFAHFLISTIAKEILRICIVGMAALSEKNAHAPSEVVGRA